MAGRSSFELGCTTCGTTWRVSMDDVQQLVAGARAFFTAHASCRTTIDLTDAHDAAALVEPGGTDDPR